MSAIAVAVSGGVDSLYALTSLRQAGEKVVAVHARLLPPELARPDYEDMLDRLRAACDTLGVALHVADCAADFASSVIHPFVRAYAQGLTPNPCALCNRRVKFGLLFDIASSLGADRLATGHYARVVTGDGSPALFAARDRAKDQSYFLSLVPAQRLANAVFPLAEKTKPQIRQYLTDLGMAVPAPSESQEICFVPQDDYRAFVLDHAARLGVTLPGPGAVVLPDGSRIGNHQGLWQYTEGQRRGLGIAWSEPLYVLEKRVKDQSLVAAPASALTGGTITVREVNFLVPFDRWPEDLLVRTRYRQQPRSATARLDGDDLLLIEQKDSGPAARGQIAAVYAQEGEELRLLAGGVISG